MALLMDYLQEDERLLIARSIDSESPINVLAIAFEMAENKLRIPRYGIPLLQISRWV